MVLFQRFPLIGLVLPLLLAINSVAQSRPSRSLTSDMTHCPSRGVDDVFVDTDGWVSVATPSGGGLATSSFQSGVSRVGGYEVHGGSRVEGLLIAGGTGSVGLVEYWTQSAVGQAWVLNSQYSLANADFCGIAHDGSRVFLLDAQSQTVLVAPWSAQNSLTGIQPTVYCDSQIAPELASASAANMCWLGAGSCAQLPGPGIFIAPSYLLGGPRLGHLVRDGSSGLLTQVFHHNQRPGLSSPVADEASTRAGDTVLTVHAANSASFTVQNAAQQVIGTSSSAPVNGVVQVALTEALVVGQRYEIHPSTGPVTAFTCIYRYGFPEAFADGTQLDRMVPRREQYYLGNAGFAFQCGVKRAQVGGSATNYIGVLIAGFDTNPIVPYDNGHGVNQLLVSEYWFGAQGFIDAGVTRGMISLPLALPETPSLEGTELFGQFAIIDGEAFVLSEVVGFKLVLGQ